MDLTRFPPEILCLILDSLSSLHDLKNVCSVSKFFHRLATPLIYRSIVFQEWSWLKSPDDEDVKGSKEATDLSFGLFLRLLDDRNEALRSFVRRVTIRNINYQLSNLHALQRLKLQNLLAGLVTKLPNLKAMYLDVPLPMSDKFVEAFLTHKGSPKLYLQRENGHTPTSITLPFVQGIHTSVNANPIVYSMDARRSTDDPFEPQTLDLNELFSTCPNIENLTIAVNHSPKRGIPPPPFATRLIPLTPETQFPPLQSLSLSGYNIARDEDDQHPWSENFPWDKLRSLSLGKRENPGFFKAATGKVHHLEKFEITSNYTEPGSCDDLNAFLSSFHSLESLTARGMVPSLVAVAQHSNLKHLCLHAIEDPEEERERISLSATEIEILDRQHPHLESLHLDINLTDKWSSHIIKAIATRFENLRELSIHIGLGIAHFERQMNCPYMEILEKAFLSILTYERAQAFADLFFEYRGPSVLKRITLQTGDNVHWYPLWHPHHAEAEEEFSRRIYAYPPQCQGDKPRITKRMRISERT